VFHWSGGTVFCFEVIFLARGKFCYELKKKKKEEVYINENWFYCKQSIKYNIRNVQIFKVVTKSVSNTLFSNRSLSNMCPQLNMIK